MERKANTISSLIKPLTKPSSKIPLCTPQSTKLVLMPKPQCNPQVVRQCLLALLKSSLLLSWDAANRTQFRMWVKYRLPG